MTKRVKLVTFTVLCTIVALCTLGWLGLRGKRLREDIFAGTATFVDDLVADRVPAQDVLNVTFIKRNPGVDAVDEVHSVTSRTGIAEIMSGLASCLKNDAYRGHRYRNHPATLPPRLEIEVLLSDGSKYQSYIWVGSNWDGESYYYARLNTWPRIRAGESLSEASRYWLHDHSIAYESRELVAVLKKCSPFLPDELKIEKNPNQASATSEPAPGAASSSPQG